MVASIALAIFSCIIVGFLDELINYDYYQIDSWDSKNLSHFGDIEKTDEYGNKLDKRWIHFGGSDWYANEITNDIKKKTNSDYGSLVRLYSYYNNNDNDRFYGESVSLWVYDIEPKLAELDITRDSLYTYIFKNYSNDTTNFLKPTRSFEPFLALSSGPRFAFSPDNDFDDEYEEQIVVFANDRIYSFNFANDKLKFGDDIFKAFDERCMEIVSNIDFTTYRKWETQYNNYITLLTKENNERTRWSRILLSIAILCLSLVFILPIQKPGKSNIQARNLFFYGTICFIISIVICLGIVWFIDPDEVFYDKTACMVLSIVAIGVGLLYTIMMAFLSYRSNENYNKEYLIPSWVINTFNIRSVVGKRLLLVVLFFPLFYLFPIPIFGSYILFYILPVSVIVLIILGLKWIVDGRKVQVPSVTKSAVANPTVTNPSLINKDTPKMYCRHCGKKIDADSGFCRYCGKKIK